MADDLRTSTDINKSAESVAAAAEELSGAVEEVNRSAQQIMATLAQIGKGAEAQSKATDQSATAVNQVENGLKVISERAEASYRKTKELSDLLAKNKANVDELIDGISLTLEANVENLKKMHALEGRSREIDKIVDTIVNVGIQTNMLAVSGAIEAARAGEYGKGFAVVASDIRNLAQDSAKNAEQIKDVVKAMQDQVVRVMRDVEAVGVTTRQEVEKVKKTTDNLKQIEEFIQVVLDGSKDIMERAAESVAAIEQAKKAVEQIASAAQEAASASEEAAAAARQQADGTQELARAVEEIAALADQLQQA